MDPYERAIWAVLLAGALTMIVARRVRVWD